MPMGGGGGGAGIPADMAGQAQDAIAAGASITAQRELMEMKHLLKLLEKKRELLEDLKEIRDKKQEELELFSHVTNKDYDGPTKIQILPPEQMEIANEGRWKTARPSTTNHPRSRSRLTSKTRMFRLRSRKRFRLRGRFRSIKTR